MGVGSGGSNLGLGVLGCVVSGTITKPLKPINNNNQEPVFSAADRARSRPAYGKMAAEIINNLLRYKLELHLFSSLTDFWSILQSIVVTLNDADHRDEVPHRVLRQRGGWVRLGGGRGHDLRVQPQHGVRRGGPLRCSAGLLSSVSRS